MEQETLSTAVLKDPVKWPPPNACESCLHANTFYLWITMDRNLQFSPFPASCPMETT